MKTEDFGEKVVKLFKWWFVIGLAIIPIVYWPRALVPYELPRVEVLMWWIRGMVLITGVSLILGKWRKRSMDMRLFGQLVIMFVIIAVTAWLGVDKYKSLIGNYYRKDGLLTWMHMLALTASVGLMWRSSWKKVTARAITLGGLLVSIVVAVDGVKYYFLHDESVSGWGGAIGSVFGQPNFLAGYLVVILPIVLWVMGGESIKKLARLLGLIILHLAILLTRSLGGLMGVMLVWVGYMMWIYPLSRKIKVVIVSVVLVGVLLMIYGVFRFDIREDFVAEGRGRIYRKMMMGGKERWLSGYGVANADYAFESVEWPYEVRFDVYVDKAHSSIVEMWVTTGLIGLVTYLVLLGYVMYKLWYLTRGGGGRKYDWWQALMLTVVVYIVHAQTNILSIAEEMIFWIVLGVLLAEPVVRKGEGEV